MEDIDLVYPKLPPSKSKVLSLIDKLLTKSLENAKKDVDEDNSDLLKIDTLEVLDAAKTKWNFLDTGSILIQDKGIQKTAKSIAVQL